MSPPMTVWRRAIRRRTPGAAFTSCIAASKWLNRYVTAVSEQRQYAAAFFGKLGRR
jgi:hypothetical protein